MIKFSPVFFLIFCSTFLLPFLALADGGAAYTFKEPVIIGRDQPAFEQSVGEALEESSRFNHYENQSLRSFSSVFVEGVDQRFLELNFNGFSLRDPSTPTGVFNVGALSSLKGSSLTLEGGSSLDLESREVKASSLGFALSNLGEAGISAAAGNCEGKSCRAFELSLERGGGYSQISGGTENDYFEQATLSGTKSFVSGETVFTSRFLYYGQVLDLDSLGPLATAAAESGAAEALNSVLFFGQDFDFSSRHRLMLSYTRSYRNQKDLPQALSFRQRGEVFESAYIYKNNLKVKAFVERFNLYSTKNKDTGFNVQRKFSLSKNFVVDLSFGKTILRSLNWSAEMGYRNLILFYKGLPPSLFQQSYNNEFGLPGGSGDQKLASQQFIGLRYSKVHDFSYFLLKWNLSYSRIFRYVDFDLLENSYENLSEVENFFTGLSFVRGPLSFLIQNQVARQVRDIKRDLPRRAPWTLGLRYEKILNKSWKIRGGVKWLSKRKAFDQSELGEAWVSDLKLSYKNLTLDCTNIFSDREEVFRNLGRKPLAIRLSYQKDF